MKVIYKYRLDPITMLSVPIHSKILTVGLQDDIPYLWVLQDNSLDPIFRTIIAYNTGDAIKESMELLHYIGTVTSSNRIVTHFFEYFGYR